MLLYEMLCGMPPFRAKGRQQLQKLITTGKMRMPGETSCGLSRTYTCIEVASRTPREQAATVQLLRNRSGRAAAGPSDPPAARPAAPRTAAAYLSNEVQSLVKGLLHKEASKRLGYGPSGSADVMGHPFFKTIDWKKLGNRQVGLWAAACVLADTPLHGVVRKRRGWAWGEAPAETAAAGCGRRAACPTRLAPRSCVMLRCPLAPTLVCCVQIPSPFRPTVKSAESIENFDKIWTDLPPTVSAFMVARVLAATVGRQRRFTSACSAALPCTPPTGPATRPLSPPRPRRTLRASRRAKRHCRTTCLR